MLNWTRSNDALARRRAAAAGHAAGAGGRGGFSKTPLTGVGRAISGPYSRYDATYWAYEISRTLRR